MAETNWIETLRTKRNAQYSSVVIVETNDDRRVVEFIKRCELTTFVDDAKVSRPIPLYIWDTVAGLFRHERTGNTWKDVPVGGGGLTDDPVSYIQRALRDERNATVIVKNILKQDDLPQKFINLWSTDPEIFGNQATAVVFVPGKDMIDLRVLEKCILVTPPLSLPDERYIVLDRLLNRGKGMASMELPNHKETVDQLVALSGGLDLNQSEAVFVETLIDFMATKNIDIARVAKTKADIITKSSPLKVMANVKNGFEAIGGYEPVKAYITENLVMPLEPRRAKELGVERPRGAILFGPGGTGKTILSKAIAKELNYPFVLLQPEGFMSSYVGETERNLARAIRVIEDMAPCIVFIDEIDRLGGRGKSGENDGGTMGRAFSQLLEWLGDMSRQAIVIGATNMPYMDEAFRREGRFDVMIPMLSPDTKARQEILKVHLNVVRQVKHSISKKKIEEVAKATEGWKGNMLEELVKRATRTAFLANATTVQDKHLMDAFEDYTINRDALVRAEDKYVQMARDLCNSQKFLKSLLEDIEEEKGLAIKKVAL